MNSSEEMIRDYERLTTGQGFVELANCSTVVVTGEDRTTFLHNLCTNDIKRLSMGESCEAFFADVKGKIIAHALVLCSQHQIELITMPAQSAAIIAHLERYIIREDVQLTNATNDFTWFVAVPGEARTEWAEGEEIPHLTPSIYGSFAGAMLGVAASKRELSRETFLACGLAECDSNLWELLRIEDELPLFGVDFDGSHLPQEVSRDHMAISFNKGCYLGQETIARIDALGHVNKKLKLLKFGIEAEPTVGLELSHNNRVVAKVTSTCWSPKWNAPLALAMVARGANDQGTQLDSGLGIATVM